MLIIIYGHSIIHALADKTGIPINNSLIKKSILIALAVFFVASTFQTSYLYGKVTELHFLKYLTLAGAVFASGLAISCVNLRPLSKNFVALLLLLASLALPGHHFAYFILIYTIPLIGWRKFFQLNLFCTSFTSLLIVLLSPLGSYNVYNPVMGHWKLSLGFNNPNTLGATCLVVLLEAAMLKDNLPWPIFGGLTSLFIILLAFSDSRTAILCYLIFLVLQIKHWGRRALQSFSFQVGAALTPFIGLLTSLILTYWLKQNPNWAILNFDQEMSNRWRQALKFLNHYGINYFGQKISVSHHSALDQGYISLLLVNGLLPTLIFLGLLSLTIYRLLQAKYVKLVIPLLIMCLYGLSESGFYSIHTNPLMISLAILILDQEQINEKI